MYPFFCNIKFHPHIAAIPQFIPNMTTLSKILVDKKNAKKKHLLGKK